MHPYLSRLAIWLVICFSLAFTTAAQADESLADMWFVTPNPGQSDQFEQALKTHLRFRQQNEDPRQWQVFVQVLGDQMDTYVIRNCCFGWDEIDGYRAWSVEQQAGAHWQETVAPLVATISHNYSSLDVANSHWPQDTSDYHYFGVTQYQIRPGHAAGVQSDVKALSEQAKAMEWPYHWSWSRPVAGAPSLMLVIPYRDHSAMAPADPNFFEALKQHMNSEKRAAKLMESWSSHFSATRYDVYRLRQDLSAR
ncbi:hypothetical protein [Ferrimonas pelagia]|uniref:Uncharacterized protein n=1 Tax=Ferrimonas pelagia TaxID=1177826 RepID=A0ABP9EW49_9GAMM